ncbi:hypothetical protein MAR_011582 [Mya arenaria]|uniref:Sema domain-containing protein n=1 Tax=Mya arenaria TaxID=6604 RepID=A0ABY7FUH3_MYAAR|nr:hypothetical protein MAR_011582 [Mya arenaria]
MEGFRRCTTILLTLAILAAVIESETEIVRRGKELSKIVPYNGSFYIADGNEVYKLNSRFDEVERANLSEHGSNDNTVTLILVDDKNNSLIVCGPFGVVCKCIHLDSLEEQFTSDDIVVQQNASHLQGIIIQKEEKSLLNLAVSLKHPEESLKMIEQFVIENHFQKAKNRYVQLKRPVQIDYRAVFQFGHHIFFFTNQQQTINDEVYISKISRVCKDGFFTFVDLQLRCNGYESYNLVQDAILINQKTLFVTFVEGQKTEEIQSDHGILCLADFEVINKTMTKEQKRVIDCENWDENTYLKNECLPNVTLSVEHIRLGNDALFCQVGGDKVSPVERQGQTMKCPIVGKTGTLIVVVND